MLPPELCEHAGIVIEGGAAFVGHGSTFQIWEPERFERHQQERRSRARGVTLPPRPNGGCPMSAAHVPGPARSGDRRARAARRRALPRRHVRLRRLQPGAARGGALPRRGDRPRSRGGAARPRPRLALCRHGWWSSAGRFGEMERLLPPLGIAALNGVALDLGVSSEQLDDARARLFVPQPTGRSTCAWSKPARAPPISSTRCPRRSSPTSSMPMARSASPAASPAPSSAPAPMAPITRHRAARPDRARRRCRRASGIDPATRTFQALRIAVNDELGELERGLAAAERLLVPGGTARRRVVPFARGPPRQEISCALRSSAAPARIAPSARGAHAGRRASACCPASRSSPSAAEIARNPRARSARLRAAERTAAPAWEAAP